MSQLFSEFKNVGPRKILYYRCTVHQGLVRQEVVMKFSNANENILGKATVLAVMLAVPVFLWGQQPKKTNPPAPAPHASAPAPHASASTHSAPPAQHSAPPNHASSPRHPTGSAAHAGNGNSGHPGTANG